MGRTRKAPRPTPRRVALAIVLALTTVPAPAPAQDPAAAPAAPRTGCHRGEPTPACRWFMLTEFGVMAEVTSGGFGEDPSRRAAWEAGPMFNRGERSAIGASLSVQSEPDFLLGMRGRYRSWLSPRVGLDLAPGVMLAEVNSGGLTTGGVALSGLLGVSYRDRIGVTLQIDRGPRTFRSYQSRQTRALVGAKLGGGLGAAAGLLVALGYVALGQSEF